MFHRITQSMSDSPGREIRRSFSVYRCNLIVKKTGCRKNLRRSTRIDPQPLFPEPLYDKEEEGQYRNKME